MIGFEKLIRDALVSKDDASLDVRSQIYDSARNALERTMAARTDISPDAIVTNRVRLNSIIETIEQEYASRQETKPAELKRVPLTALRRVAKNETNHAPSVGSVQKETASSGKPPPKSNVPSVEAEQKTNNQSADIQRRFLSGRFYVIVSVIIIICIFMAWFFLQFQSRETTEPKLSQLTTSSQNPDPEAPATDDEEWIVIFDPSQPEAITSNDAGEIRLVSYLNQQSMQMQFLEKDNTTGEFQIEVGQGILERYAGQALLFDLSMVAVEEPVALSLSCDFNTLGGCGRKRYTVPIQPASMVFSVQLPEGSPEGTGVLILRSFGKINADAKIQLFSVKINPEDG